MNGKVQPIPEGFHSLTPYLICPRVPKLLEFLRQAFYAEETWRSEDPAGLVVHASARIAGSMIEMADSSPRCPAMISSLHYYVPDVDSVFQRAIKAGAAVLSEVRDHDYGDREGSVADPSGNQWHIATHKAGSNFIRDGLRSITPYLSVKGAAEFLNFLGKAFNAEVVFKHASKDGIVGYSQVRIGDSVLECSEAHGEWGPRQVALHFYVSDVDATYKQALATGGKSLTEPRDQFYGERNAGVLDPLGNHWYIATHTEDLTAEEIQCRAAQAATAK